MAAAHTGILQMHRDLIELRRGGEGLTRGLRGPSVAILRADEDEKILVMHRWSEGGPGDDVIVVVNLADRHVDALRVGMPARGRWRVRFNSDSPTYARDFGGHEALDTEADPQPADGFDQSALVSVGPYSVIVLSQDD